MLKGELRAPMSKSRKMDSMTVFVNAIMSHNVTRSGVRRRNTISTHGYT